MLEVECQERTVANITPLIYTISSTNRRLTSKANICIRHLLFMKLLLAFIIAFGIGFACRWFDIPVPAPPAWQGVLLIAAITFGYVIADRIASPPGARSKSEAVTDVKR